MTTISFDHFRRIVAGLTRWANRIGDDPTIDRDIAAWLPDGAKDENSINAVKSAWANCRQNEARFAQALSTIACSYVEFSGYLYMPGDYT